MWPQKVPASSTAFALSCALCFVLCLTYVPLFCKWVSDLCSVCCTPCLAYALCPVPCALCCALLSPVPLLHASRWKDHVVYMVLQVLNTAFLADRRLGRFQRLWEQICSDVERCSGCIFRRFPVSTNFTFSGTLQRAFPCAVGQCGRAPSPGSRDRRCELRVHLTNIPETRVNSARGSLKIR